LLFIVRNHVFFLFLMLEAFALTLTVRNNSIHSSSWFNTSNKVVGAVYSVNHRITEYFKLNVVNRQLAEENAMLRGMLRQSQHVVADSCDAIPVIDTIYQQRYTYIPARVVNFTVNRQANYMTIDRGRGQGIHPEMAVISPDGVVGIVKDASEHYATVLPLLNRKSSISARLRGPGYFGALRWDGRDPLIVQLHDIPIHVELQMGMIVETSGLSSMFPEGIAIGKVVGFGQNTGENFHNITVELNTDPRTLHKVYVVNNMMGKEQLELEQAIGSDD
ncbi:MAG: rod shape-determining protein MreC, partial [Flavobacteriales bacterium]|nr:rod shape-determining protein MreC [Flavobacteriales bacterium]